MAGTFSESASKYISMTFSHTDVIGGLAGMIHNDPETEDDRGSLLATCPYCKKVCKHTLEQKNEIRKDRFVCGDCKKNTCKCVKFNYCNGMAKSNFLWDEALCRGCNLTVERYSNGEIGLEQLVKEMNAGTDIDGPKKPCRHNVNPDALSMLAYVFLPPFDDTSAETPTGATIFAEEVDDRKFQSTLREEQSCEQMRSNVIRDEDVISLGVRPTKRAIVRLGATNLMSEGLESREELLYEVEREECLSRYMKVSEPINECPEIIASAVRDAVNRANAKTWEIMRDALLTWPGPERSDIDLYREMICHKGSSNDPVWALKRILTHLKWRQEYRVDTIMEEDWADYDKRGEMYPCGLDKDGRPTWTWNTQKHGRTVNSVPPNSSPEMGARYLICTLERTWAMNPSADRMNVICNCENLTFSNYEHSMCLICLEILSEQYPDNMEYCFMFPAGWIMQAIMAIGRPMMSDETYHKHKVLTSDKYRECLAQHYDLDQLEENMGGTLDLAASLTRRWLLEDTSRIRAWLEEEEAAYRLFDSDATVCELQRQVLPEDKKLLAGSGRAAPSASSMPFGHCRDLWPIDRAQMLEQFEVLVGLRKRERNADIADGLFKPERPLLSSPPCHEVESSDESAQGNYRQKHGNFDGAVDSQAHDDSTRDEREAAQRKEQRGNGHMEEREDESDGTVGTTFISLTHVFASKLEGWSFFACCASFAVQSGSYVGRGVAKAVRSAVVIDRQFWQWEGTQKCVIVKE
eukprot:768461-Hanusia_phi.AAC.2